MNAGLEGKIPYDPVDPMSMLTDSPVSYDADKKGRMEYDISADELANFVSKASWLANTAVQPAV